MSDNPEDYELVHYGVKGMKWGVRRAEKKAERARQDTEIKEARARNIERGKKVDAKLDEGINAFIAGDQKKSDRLVQQARKLEVDQLMHPDAQIASRMTSGERRVQRANNIALATILAASGALAIKSGMR